MMKILNRLNSITAAVGLLLIVAPAQAEIKCWHNKDGIKECGHIVPPEYAQQEIIKKNEAGVTTEVTPRAQTREELEAARQAAEAQAAAEKRLADAEAARQARDKVLLDTYQSVQDMELARAGKITAIESQISISQKLIEKLQNDMNDRIAQAAEGERKGETVSEELQKSIEDLRAQIKNNEEYIVERRGEQDNLRAQFAKDIAHYRSLRGEAADAAVSPAADAEQTAGSPPAE